MPFDFYLPNLNICVEYDGIQHFEKVDIWGGEETLIEQQKRDEIKNVFCKNNEIQLIRINYKQDINSELKKYIKI